MAKKYIVRKFNPGKEDHNKIENTLINLSSLNLNASQSVLQTSLALGASETNNALTADALYPYDNYVDDSQFQRHRDITKNTNQAYAYFDMSYSQRRDQLRLFSQYPTITNVLETISDETIILDENNYFAQLDLDLLKLRLNKDYKGPNGEDADMLISNCQKAFKLIYQKFGWDKSNDAWNFFKQFLVEGYLAFEIVVDNLMKPTEIIGFKVLDPVTLEPEIGFDPVTGQEIKIWYQFKGDATLERRIPDSNIIYISWASGMIGERNRVSYLEGLIRSYTMLTQLESSRIIWNIMNAQKRVKVGVPVGGISNDKARAKVNEVRAEWNEETTIDEISGEVVVNGNPKFSFTKTYFFPKRDNGEMTVEEMATEGYDLSDITPLKYFWRRFILDTKIPPNRFNLDIAGDTAHPLGGDDASITREEYAFNRFISRLRNVYREILLKPLWVQVCIMMPELANSELLKQYLGIVYNEENSFVEAKKRTALKQGADIIGTLAQLQIGDKPYFSMKFLVEKYLGMSEEELALNEKYKQGEILERLEQAKILKQHQESGPQADQVPEENGEFTGDFGGGGGGGADFGGGDFGGGSDDFGGGGGDFGGSDEVFSGGDTGLGSGGSEIE